MDSHALCEECPFKQKCPRKRFEIVVDGKTMWVCYRQFLRVIIGI